jgi:hypothetical protein
LHMHMWHVHVHVHVHVHMCMCMFFFSSLSLSPLTWQRKRSFEMAVRLGLCWVLWRVVFGDRQPQRSATGNLVDARVGAFTQLNERVTCPGQEGLTLISTRYILRKHTTYHNQDD